jgi:hypothetical protein
LAGNKFHAEERALEGAVILPPCIANVTRPIATFFSIQPTDSPVKLAKLRAAPGQITAFRTFRINQTTYHFRIAGFLKNKGRMHFAGRPFPRSSFDFCAVITSFQINLMLPAGCARRATFFAHGLSIL